HRVRPRLRLAGAIQPGVPRRDGPEPDGMAPAGPGGLAGSARRALISDSANDLRSRRDGPRASGCPGWVEQATDLSNGPPHADPHHRPAARPGGPGRAGPYVAARAAADARALCHLHLRRVADALGGASAAPARAEDPRGHAAFAPARDRVHVLAALDGDLRHRRAAYDSDVPGRPLSASGPGRYLGAGLLRRLHR